MQGYLRILRPLNCIMAGFAVLIGAKIGSPVFISQPVFLAIAAAFLICGAGNAINDYFDFEIDSVNNPKRPLPSGELTVDNAYTYSILLFLIGMLIAFFINIPAFIIAIINSLLLFFYAKTIKRVGGFTKNLTVSYLVASPFLFGGVAVSNYSVTLFLVFLAFLVNTSREVVKDIEDYEGDVKHLESLPVKFGFKTAAIIASTFMGASILLSIAPYKMRAFNSLYLVIILMADALLVYSTITLMNSPKEKASKVQKLIKFAMLLALLAFFLGTF